MPFYGSKGDFGAGRDNLVDAILAQQQGGVSPALIGPGMNYGQGDPSGGALAGVGRGGSIFPKAYLGGNTPVDPNNPDFTPYGSLAPSVSPTGLVNEPGQPAISPTITTPNDAFMAPPMARQRGVIEMPNWFSGGSGDWTRALQRAGLDNGGDGGFGGTSGVTGGDVTGGDVGGPGGPGGQGPGGQGPGGSTPSGVGGSSQFGDIATGGIAPVGSSFFGGGNPLTAEQLLESQGIPQGPVNPTTSVERGGFLEAPNSPFANPITDPNQAFPSAPNNPANAPFSFFNPDNRDALMSFNQANVGQQGGFSTAGMSLSDLAEAWGVGLDSAAALAGAGFADLSGFGDDSAGGGPASGGDQGGGVGGGGAAGVGEGEGDDDDGGEDGDF